MTTAAISTCDVCHTDNVATNRAVIGGVYHQHVCHNCIAGNTINPRDASFNRRADQDEHAKEILQPFNRDGTVNSDFAEAYRSDVKGIVGEENLKNV